MYRLWMACAAILILAMTGCAQKPATPMNKYSTAYEGTIPAGKTLAGTDLKYLGKTDKGAEVVINGQTTLRQTLDSLTWNGQLVPGTTANLNLRVLTFDEKELRAGGTAEITVANPQPRPIAPAALPKDALVFKGFVAYAVPWGRMIPGTGIRYDGVTAAPDGSKQAKLAGVDGYPYRKTADSVVWTGQLADRTWIDLETRVVSFDAKTLSLTGAATLYVKP